MHSKISCLNDGFVQLIDHMGSDTSICNAARVSYGNHNKDPEIEAYHWVFPDANDQPVKIDTSPSFAILGYPDGSEYTLHWDESQFKQWNDKVLELEQKNRNLIRYLMRHRHTTPFEMVSFIFLVRCPIHVARQWMRHRTWSYNEYSTRYKSAIDSFETTEPNAWRKQSTNNKQGSGEYFDKSDKIGEIFPYREQFNKYFPNVPCLSYSEASDVFCYSEEETHERIRKHYKGLLEAGVAREQARKDLPLSTYTEFYAKVDLHNLFHFLSLRLDSHAQLEIRTYAEAISNLIKPIVPVSYEAFEDYRLNGSHFSSQEMNLLRTFLSEGLYDTLTEDKPDSLSDREWKEFKEKLNEH